jgi:hypothetical protein
MTEDIVKIILFVPLGACSCTYQNFIDRAWDVMMPFNAKLDVEMKDVSSPEGDAHDVFQNTILVLEDGTKFTSTDKFKQYLETKFKY